MQLTHNFRPWYTSGEGTSIARSIPLAALLPGSLTIISGSCPCSYISHSGGWQALDGLVDGAVEDVVTSVGVLAHGYFAHINSRAKPVCTFNFWTAAGVPFSDLASL